jgi:hypothetical protein
MPNTYVKRSAYGGINIINVPNDQSNLNVINGFYSLYLLPFFIILLSI